MTAPVAPPAMTPFEHWLATLHHNDIANVLHEAERLESLPPSPLCCRMRAAVDAELTTRQPQAVA